MHEASFHDLVPCMTTNPNMTYRNVFVAKSTAGPVNPNGTILLTKGQA